MPQHQSKAEWAAEVALRLKGLQTSWADDDPSMRREYLESELRRSLAETPESERSDYVSALKARFPTWSPGESKIVEVPVEAPRKELTPEELVDELTTVSHRLTDEQRKTLSRRLLGAGFEVERVVREPAPVADPPPPPPPPAPTPSVSSMSMGLEIIPADVAAALGLRSNVGTSSHRVFYALKELTLALSKIDGVGRVLWREVSDNAPLDVIPLNSRADLAQQIGEFVGAPGTLSEEAFSQRVGDVRRFLSVLVYAYRSVAKDGAEEILKTYSPEAIGGIVNMEQGGMNNVLKSRKGLNWDKFEEIWRRRGLGGIEEDILGTLPSAVRALLHGGMY